VICFVNLSNDALTLVVCSVSFKRNTLSLNLWHFSKRERLNEVWMLKLMEIVVHSKKYLFQKKLYCFNRNSQLRNPTPHPWFAGPPETTTKADVFNVVTTYFDNSSLKWKKTLGCLHWSCSGNAWVSKLIYCQDKTGKIDCCRISLRGSPRGSGLQDSIC